MRTGEEISKALQDRIKQLDQGFKALEKANGPFLTRAIYQAVQEELDTFLKWMSQTAQDCDKGND